MDKNKSKTEGNISPMKKFLQQNPRIAMVVVENGEVTLKPTETLSKLDKELSGINFMLGAETPAKNTAFRIVSDSKGKVNISATAVFSEKKPYLHFSKNHLGLAFQIPWFLILFLDLIAHFHKVF